MVAHVNPVMQRMPSKLAQLVVRGLPLNGESEILVGLNFVSGHIGLVHESQRARSGRGLQ